MSNSALKKTAAGALRLGDTHTAIGCFEEVSLRKPDNVNNLEKLSELHAALHNYESALIVLDQILSLEPNYDPQRLYTKGLYLKNLGQYNKAMLVFDDYIELIRRDQNLREWRKKAEQAKEGCDSALVSIENQLNIDINRLPTQVNGPHIEFNPIELNPTTLVYSALKEDSIKRFHIDSVKPKRAFYYAEKVDDTWNNKGEWNKQLSDEAADLGNGAFNADSSKFYFTKCIRNWKGEVNCKIWVGNIDIHGKIYDQTELGDEINTPGSSNSQPALGTETRRGSEILYFVSDREGGRGGTDIWAAVYNDRSSKFKSPKNLGRKINTEFNEVTPFYQESKRKLFYSSDRPIGMGGLDIFSSRGENRKWAGSESMGYPINSNADELYFMTTTDPAKGYFTSNRMGTTQMFHPTCCDDIFSFEFRDYIFIHVEGLIVEVPDSMYVQGLGDNSHEQKLNHFPPLEGSEVELFILEDGEEILMQSFEVGESGKYVLDLEPEKKYRLQVSKPGFLNNFIDVNTLGKTYSDTIGIDLGLAILNDAPIAIPNIYYDFDSAALTPEAEQSIQQTLLKILQDNPGIEIEIGSHTDSRGEESYNQTLSQKRADAVVTYLIAAGIASRRLKAKGHGESDPVAPNTFEDGSDNPSGRQKNRRTEFTIIGNQSRF